MIKYNYFDFEGRNGLDYIHNELADGIYIYEWDINYYQIEYFKDGLFHRDDGPAVVESNGSQAWYQYGEYHRNDGPAIIYPNGFQAWYQHGKIVQEEKL